MNENEEIEIFLKAIEKTYIDKNNFSTEVLIFDKAVWRYIRECLRYFYHFRFLYECDRDECWLNLKDETEEIQDLFNEWKFR